MRTYLLAAIAILALSSPVLAHGTDNGPIPRHIANIANGFDYQPTPSEVAPREREAGIEPSADQQRAIDQELGNMDADLLRSEGLSTRSVPNMTNTQSSNAGRT
jgi:hypothetical protein